MAQWASGLLAGVSDLKFPWGHAVILPPHTSREYTVCQVRHLQGGEGNDGNRVCESQSYAIVHVRESISCWMHTPRHTWQRNKSKSRHYKRRSIMTHASISNVFITALLTKAATTLYMYFHVIWPEADVCCPVYMYMYISYLPDASHTCNTKKDGLGIEKNQWFYDSRKHLQQARLSLVRLRVWPDIPLRLTNDVHVVLGKTQQSKGLLKKNATCMDIHTYNWD